MTVKNGYICDKWAEHVKKMLREQYKIWLGNVFFFRGVK